MNDDEFQQIKSALHELSQISSKRDQAESDKIMYTKERFNEISIGNKNLALLEESIQNVKRESVPDKAGCWSYGIAIILLLSAINILNHCCPVINRVISVG